MMMKKTIVLGASPKPERYSYKAVKMLVGHNHTVIAIGNRADKIEETQIITGLPEIQDVDTITIYLSAENQIQYYNYILRTNPKRIIFNPGAENAVLENIALVNDIEVVEGCTLVMLGNGLY